MDIFRENEDKIVKIRIWNEREKAYYMTVEVEEL